MAKVVLITSDVTFNRKGEMLFDQFLQAMKLIVDYPPMKTLTCKVA